MPSVHVQACSVIRDMAVADTQKVAETADAVAASSLKQ
jgi:hypothetical protein